MNALADGPDLGSPVQSAEDFHGIVGDNLVELAHESLVGAEHDRADRIGVGLRPLRHRRRRPALSKARAQPELDGPVVVRQGAYRVLVLSDARGRQGLHGADDGLEISGALNLPAQALGGLAHDPSPEGAVGFGVPFARPSGLGFASGFALGFASGFTSGLG